MISDDEDGVGVSAMVQGRWRVGKRNDAVHGSNPRGHTDGNKTRIAAWPHSFSQIDFKSPAERAISIVLRVVKKDILRALLRSRLSLLV